MAISKRTSEVVEAGSSRYTQGGETDVYPNRTGWWERRPLQKDDTDLLLVIRPDEDRRPDKIAKNAYNRENLSWVVLQFNNIVDPEVELVTGAEIRLPTLRRLTLDILSRPTGGNRIT